MNNRRCPRACAALVLAPLGGLDASEASKPPRRPTVIVRRTDDFGHHGAGGPLTDAGRIAIRLH